MAKSKPNPKVDFFFNKATQWQAEFKKLRKIILDCGLIWAAAEEIQNKIPLCRR